MVEGTLIEKSMGRKMCEERREETVKDETMKKENNIQGLKYLTRIYP